MKSIKQLNLFLSVMQDKRKYKFKIQYKMEDVLTIILCGLLCGCEDIKKIHMYAKNKENFFKKYFNIKNIPSVQTMYRILQIVDYEMLDMLIEAWIRYLIPNLKGKVLSLDGKEIVSTERRSAYDRPLYTITAYLGELGVSLRQFFVEGKGNEIKAVQEMIEIINIEGMIITADANHCQKKTVEKIIENKGDYVIQVKKNQGNFYADIKEMFNDKISSEYKKDKEDYEYYEEREKNGNRIEKRACYVLKDIEYFTSKKEWKELKNIFAVEREVEIKGKVRKEYSYYITSLEASPKELLYYSRNHWMIESMHWLLDTNLREDKCKLVNKNAQKVLNILRKVSLDFHKRYLNTKNIKKPMSNNMFECLLDDNKLLDVLSFLITQ